LAMFFDHNTGIIVGFSSAATILLLVGLIGYGFYGPKLFSLKSISSLKPKFDLFNKTKDDKNAYTPIDTTFKEE